MKTGYEEQIKKIYERIAALDHVKGADIPNIDLYMDQVTTFMEEQLSSSKRYEEDKILTKTMINNYAKNNLLPPPAKKKYSKEHLLLLVFIYYFKNILSIKDIEKLLKPLATRHFSNDSDYPLSRLYDEVWNMEPSRKEALLQDFEKICQESLETFQDAPDDDKEDLHRFSLICALSFDVYIKKMMIELLIDEIPEPASEKKEHKERDEK